jgi:Chalcone isomerase-like
MHPLPRTSSLNRWAALLILTAGLALQPARALEPVNPIGGVRFEPQAQVAGQALQLNGTGLRALRIFKAYAAALYLPQRGLTAEAVLAQPGAKRLQIRMLWGVPAQEFVKAFHVGVQRNHPPEVQAQLAERIARFDAMLEPLGKIASGDTVNLDFQPGLGMVLVHNGRTVGSPIPGDDFYAALLRVFVGEQVSDDRLRAGLLGQAT